MNVLLLAACALLGLAQAAPDVLTGTKTQLPLDAKLPAGAAANRKAHSECLKEYNQWAAAPCAGAPACCPVLTGLGGECLKTVTDTAAVLNDAAIKAEIAAIYAACSDHWNEAITGADPITPATAAARRRGSWGSWGKGRGRGRPWKGGWGGHGSHGDDTTDGGGRGGQGSHDDGTTGGGGWTGNPSTGGGGSGSGGWDGGDSGSDDTPSTPTPVNPTPTNPTPTNPTPTPDGGTLIPPTPTPPVSTGPTLPTPTPPTTGGTGPSGGGGTGPTGGGSTGPTGGGSTGPTGGSTGPTGSGSTGPTGGSTGPTGGGSGSTTATFTPGISGCPDIQAALDAHNAARARRGAPPLQWSDKLAQYAQGVSNTCKFEHSNGPYGENLAWSSGGITCKEAVDMWMEEEANWRPGMGFSSNTGHFTQASCARAEVVWKSTTAVGCGLKCNIVTCSYDPPGNYGGQYDANVGSVVSG